MAIHPDDHAYLAFRETFPDETVQSHDSYSWITSISAFCIKVATGFRALTLQSLLSNEESVQSHGPYSWITSISAFCIKVASGFRALTLQSPPSNAEATSSVGSELEDDATLVDPEEDDASSTTSATSEVFNFREENNRIYHGYKDGKYLIPIACDKIEFRRLELYFDMWTIILDGSLTSCRTPTYGRVLDGGTGTGRWAAEYACQNPNLNVLAVDLCPPTRLNLENCQYLIDDIEDEWKSRTLYTLVFLRGLVGCIASWQALFDNAFKTLEPGGYIEVQDIDRQIRADDDSLNDSMLYKWSDTMENAAVEHGRSIAVFPHLEEMMVKAGFEMVNKKQGKLPINSRGQTTSKAEELGKLAQQVLGDHLTDISIASLTRVLQWTPSDAHLFLYQVKQEWDKNNGAYMTWYIISGRKPL